MEKSLQIVIVVIVILATALIIMIIFNKGMGDWMSIFDSWSGTAADEATCRQACIRECAKTEGGTASYNVAQSELKGTKSCEDLLGTCTCGFGLTNNNNP